MSVDIAKQPAEPTVYLVVCNSYDFGCIVTRSGQVTSFPGGMKHPEGELTAKWIFAEDRYKVAGLPHDAGSMGLYRRTFFGLVQDEAFTAIVFIVSLEEQGAILARMQEANAGIMGIDHKMDASAISPAVHRLTRPITTLLHTYGDA